MVREEEVRDARAPGSDDAGDGAPGPAGGHLLELWSDREEIHAVPELLRPAEGLVAVGSGTVVRSGRLAQSKWLVVLTDRRLLCIKGRSAATRKVIDMPVSAIRGVETKGVFRKSLVLDTGYGALRIGGMKNTVTAEMVDGLTTLMGAFSDEPEPAAAIPRADLSKAGTGRGHTHEELDTLERDVDGLQGATKRLETTVEELTDRVAFLEELVRSNVAQGERREG